MKYFAISMVLCNSLSAQNFVPNAGFELYTLCPLNPSQFNRIQNWYNPSVNPSTPDYFHQCNGWYPASALGYQLDHSNGGAYVGIYGYGGGSSFIDPREYIQVQLSDTLALGSKYCVEYFLSLFQNSEIAITTMGAWLSDSAYFLASNTYMPIQPSIENPDTVLLRDTLNWMRIYGIYTAHGGEKFLTIGNFRDSASSHIAVIDTSQGPNWMFAYYIIDDVSIINCDSLFNDINEISLNNIISIYPNPAKENITIDFNGYALENVQVRIFNLIGEEKQSHYSPWTNNVKIDLKNLEAGLYIVEIQTKNSNVANKFIKD